ncbi:hypothetical protein HK104_000893 [Borealophlyctis nickersoniae]|nr:hypothetical protein HK104_000893 [Borealophlyctis nickersoniae]
MNRMTCVEHALTRHNEEEEFRAPRPREYIKLRLPYALAGPGSNVSSSAPSGATRHNYHSVLVLSSKVDTKAREFHLEVLPVPSYSAAPDPVSWVTALPEGIRRDHLPIQSNTVTPDTDPASPSFGIRLQCGYTNQLVPHYERRPAWILSPPATVSLKFSSTWKSYEPPVSVSEEELLLLREYINKQITVSINFAKQSPWGPAAMEAFSAMGQGGRVERGENSDEEDEDSQDRTSDYGDDGDGMGMSEYLRSLSMLYGTNVSIAGMIKRLEADKVQSRNERVMSWLGVAGSANAAETRNNIG